jgi:hypothetical protein
MASPIILLGPHRSGKTTVGKLLSEQLGLPLIHFSTIAPEYRKEIGYDEAGEKEAWSQGFWEGFYRYMQPFEAHAIERAVPGLDDCILELDAQQAAFDDPELLRRVRKALEPEIGWSQEEQQRIRDAEGFTGVYRYWKPFEAHAVGRLLAEHGDCVIDFGAGHSVYEDDAQFARVQELLAPYPNVVLLLPSPDLDESVAILRERTQVRIGGLELNRFFCTHMLKLAKQVVTTEGKTPKETAQQIITGSSSRAAPT